MLSRQARNFQQRRQDAQAICGIGRAGIGAVHRIRCETGTSTAIVSAGRVIFSNWRRSKG